MHLYGRWGDRLRALARRNGVADEIREEIEFHLQERQREYERRGLSAEDARRAALQRFGNPAVIHDRGYDVRGGGAMESILQDVRYAFRVLIKQPASTTVALLTLALGIGCTAALFSVIEAALIRPLPYPDPEQLVAINMDGFERGELMYGVAPSLDDVRRWRAESSVLSHVGAGYVSGFLPLIVDSGTPERLSVADVSEDFVETYGVWPMLGRGLTAHDTRRGAPAVAILGNSFWRRRFAGDPAVIGRIIRLENVPTEIVGVLPADFYPETAVWRPIRAYAIRGSGTPVVGRLKPGISLEQAARDLDRVIDAAAGAQRPPPHTVLTSLYEYETSQYRVTVATLAVSVGLILIMACVNVAGLLLARGSARGLELGIRVSLGAGRLRLVRQLLTEASLLAFVSAGLGLCLAWMSLDSLVALIPLALPVNAPAKISLPVFAFTLLVAITTVLMCGLIPALRLSRGGCVVVPLAGIGRAGTPFSRRMGHLLVGGQVALACVLLTGAGLVVRSFAQLVTVDVGYDPASILTMDVEPLDRSAAVRDDYYRALTAAVRAMPNVEAVGGLDRFALTGGWSGIGLKNEAGQLVEGPLRTVLPGFFEALAVRAVAGRVFTVSDRVSAESPAVVNILAATRYFGGNAVGQTLGTDGRLPRRLRIVGVVPNLQHGDPSGPPEPQVYVLPEPDIKHESAALSIILRRRPGTSISYEQLKSVAEAIGPRVLIGTIRPMDAIASEQVKQPRHRTVLLGLLGGFGLILTLVGIFSMTAYAVARRTREIGIRIAFGATPRDVVRQVVRDTMWPVLMGLSVGVGVAFYATRMMAAFLFQTTPHDPGTFAAVAILVTLGAGLAAWAPARLAARVEPVTALRAD